MNKKLAVFAVAFVALASLGLALRQTKKTAPPVWPSELTQELADLDSELGGEFGVYVKRLSDGSTMSYNLSTRWYLASTTKVLVAAHLLQEADSGKIRLDEKIVLKKSDFVDGSGQVNSKKPGATVTVEYLLEQMLTQSDSTATDVLIRKLGEDKLNAFVQSQMPGSGHISTIVDVRYGAYKQAHPNAVKLTNMDFISFKKVPPRRRLDAFARKLRLRTKDIRVKSVEEAFEKYYQTGENSADLAAFGAFLERLLTGKVLSSDGTARITKLMESAITGKGRIQDSLPEGARFAQKTGTQVDRVCNVGRIEFANAEQVIITACARGFGDIPRGERILKQIGAKAVKHLAGPA